MRSIDASWKNPGPAVADAERYLAEGMTVMFLTTCSYMLAQLVKELRDSGIPFHNPYRRRNGAWNPLQKRRGQTSTADRVLASLQMGRTGIWSAEDIIRWTDMAKVKGVLNANGRQTARKLTDEEDGGVNWENIQLTLTEEAIEAGLTSDLDWFEESLTAAKKAAVQRQLLLPVPSIILVGSPPVPDCAAGPLRCGSWGRRIPG